MSRLFIRIMAGWVALLGCAGQLAAGTIAVPNASFESSGTSSVSSNISVSVTIDYWQKSPQPSWFDPSDGFFWVGETGVFKNTPVGASDHIDDCDGTNAIWLFAVSQVALFQDYNTIDANHPIPLHLFNAVYEVGKSYQLTVGVMGGGGGMPDGTTLDLNLYYRDSASNMVIVADTSVTNTLDTFPVHTHLVDFQVRVPTVRASDPWAGQHIGIQFNSPLTSTDPNGQPGGYWDLDNVRLASAGAPMLTSPVYANGQFHFTVQSEPGASVQILATTNPSLPLTNWTALTTVTNVAGSIQIVDTNANSGQRFYQAIQLRQ